jgi:hypothetical protein
MSCSEAIQVYCFVLILRDTASLLICDPKVVFGIGMSLGGSRPIPLQGFPVIPGNPQALVVQRPKVELSVGIPSGVTQKRP